MYIYLPNKSAATYIRALRQLCVLAPELQPESWMIDFESGMIPAVNDVFDWLELFGCLFHFNQSLFRKVQSEGLKNQYETDPVFQLIIRQFAALGFVKIEHLHASFNALVDSIPPPYLNQLQGFITYFQVSLYILKN